MQSWQRKPMRTKQSIGSMFNTSLASRFWFGIIILWPRIGTQSLITRKCRDPRSRGERTRVIQAAADHGDTPRNDARCWGEQILG